MQKGASYIDYGSGGVGSRVSLCVRVRARRYAFKTDESWALTKKQGGVRLMSWTRDGRDFLAWEGRGKSASALSRLKGTEVFFMRSFFRSLERKESALP